MSRSRIDPILQLMLDEAEFAISFIDGMTEADFMMDQRTRRAVAMCLLNLGELVAKLFRLYAPVLESYPQIPWASMLGMRNRIAHNYTEINFEVVWDTVSTGLPSLVKILPTVIRNAKTDTDSPAPTLDSDS